MGKKYKQTRNHLPVGLTLPPESVAEIDKRGELRSPVLHRMIMRQATALAKAGDNLREHFTPKEWAVLLAALPEVNADTLIELHAWELVEREIIRHDLAKGYKVDARALMNKLSALDVLHTWALVDVIERWRYLSKRVDPADVNPFKWQELIA